jgi:hypothetical protein
MGPKEIYTPDELYAMIHALQLLRSAFGRDEVYADRGPDDRLIFSIPAFADRLPEPREPRLRLVTNADLTAA